MQINLKQPEIVAALKQYIAAQGISIAGKRIEITFTAHYKRQGVSAEIQIEDIDGPKIVLDPSELEAPVLSVVPFSKQPEFSATDHPFTQEPARPEPEPAPAKTSSLFA